MHTLESTDTPGLYKRKGTFWCRIQVGKKTCERSLRTTSKNAAIETMSRWRREMGITAARSAHAGGNDKRDTIGWWLVRLRHKYRRDPQTSAKHKLFIAERVQAIKASWPALACPPEDEARCRYPKSNWGMDGRAVGRAGSESQVEVIPYIEGAPAGEPVFPKVAWSKTMLYVGNDTIVHWCH